MRPFGQSVDDLILMLDTHPQHGLRVAEARARLERHGRNELPSPPPIPSWRRLLGQFRDVLVLLLLAATIVSTVVWAYERDTALPYDAIAILVVVLLNALVGFVHESRAEAAVAALRAMSASEATVIRDGERQRIAASAIVPGDLLLLEEGDMIPADARVIESASLQTTEAALTGESLPVSKATVTLPADVALADRINMVFAGTAATFGHGRALVTETGVNTEVGHIASLLKDLPAEPTPLQRELDRAGRRLGLAVVAMAVVIIVTIVFVEHVRSLSALVDVLLLGVALAVAAVPEGLPAIVAAVLSIGVQRMAKRHAVVRHLASVETLGSATVIASDKTGTLTKNEMTVRVVVTATGRVTFDGSGYAPVGAVHRDGGGPIDGPLALELEHALTIADRANNAAVVERAGKWTVHGDPTEGALLVAARKAGMASHRLDEQFARISELPFSSERKLMSTIHRTTVAGGADIILTKGAPDILLSRCSSELVGTERRTLTAARRAALLATNEALADAALRTLGLASGTLAGHSRAEPLPPSDANVEQELTFVGLVGIIDPPRPEARDAVARAKRAGIRPIMITGDHPRTAMVIARELGITTSHEVLLGRDIELLAATPAGRRQLQAAAVFARVGPEDKLRIVNVLRDAGAVVAMTGDGVNDAPALKRADIGIAMGVAGTDVAKEAADMLLADDNFASIVAAVEEGRAIFANIRKFLRYLLSSNTGEVLTMFVGVILARPIGLDNGESDVVLPLLATQILWLNLVTDGPPALALGVDPADDGLMDQPPRPAGEGVLTSKMWSGIVFDGTVMASGTLFVLDASLPGGLITGSGTLPHAQTMAFTTLMLSQLFNVFNARSDERSAFSHLFSNRWLWVAAGGSLALQVLVVHVPALQRGFGTVDLTMTDWLFCTVVASGVLWLREGRKAIARTSRRG